MSFFNGFPFTSYKVGNETDVAYIQDISAYVDIIDQVKENVSIYQKYDILDGERPDVLSEKLYGSTKYYWTFYLMNDSIRKNGFPLSSNELDVWVKKKYPNTTLVTRDYFFTKMQIDVFKHLAISQKLLEIQRHLQHFILILEIKYFDHVDFKVDLVLTIVIRDYNTLSIFKSHYYCGALGCHVTSLNSSPHIFW